MNTKKNMWTEKPGENAKMLRHMREVAALGPPLDLSCDVEGVRKRIVDYFALCEKNDVKPAVSALAMALGTTRDQFYHYRKGDFGKSEEIRNLFKQAQSILDALMEGYMQQGMINPVSGIVLMRNNHGYKNQDVPSPEEEPPKLPEANVQQLAEKYLADVPRDE